MFSNVNMKKFVKNKKNLIIISIIIIIIYNQLNELWQLIEAKDWETLTAMDKKMKEDEEQLQKEWKCYE